MNSGNVFCVQVIPSIIRLSFFVLTQNSMDDFLNIVQPYHDVSDITSLVLVQVFCLKPITSFCLGITTLMLVVSYWEFSKHILIDDEYFPKETTYKWRLWRYIRG